MLLLGLKGDSGAESPGCRVHSSNKGAKLSSAALHHLKPATRASKGALLRSGVFMGANPPWKYCCAPRALITSAPTFVLVLMRRALKADFFGT